MRSFYLIISNWTYLATQVRRPEVVVLLIAHGANVTVKTKYEMTALDIGTFDWYIGTFT